MHDIKLIRENPEAFDAAMQRRGLGALSDELLALDKASRGDATELQKLQERSNTLAKEIGALMGQGKKDEAAPLMAESKEIKAKIAAAKDEAEQGGENLALRERLLDLPNALDDDVPEGKTEDDNKELRKHGEPTAFDFAAKEHDELGEALGLMDFEQTAKISGARFVTLMGDLAKLERALAQYMLDVQTKEHGFTEMSVPLLVRDEAMIGTGQLPKFAEDAFQTTDGRWLISTSEIALANQVRESIIDAADLPLRYTALTPCFRSEAGSAGKDTRGMIRHHQFWKVELVSVTDVDASNDEHEFITQCAETILQRLEIPYRVMLLCSGDTGFGARKTYDLEAWLPGQGRYREISSCSNCGDFQARRMNARTRNANEKETRFVHTLNGSGLAVGRTLIAVLENYQQADGSIAVPKVLQPYMGNQEIISK